MVKGELRNWRRKRRNCPKTPAPSLARGSRERLAAAAPLDSGRYFNNFGNMEKQGVLGGLAALAQETRLDIFRLLVARGPAGLAAGNIGARLELPAATLSFHLKELRRAGLVTCRRAGRSLIYAADFTAMRGLVGYLTENCCGGGCEAPAPEDTQEESLA